MRMTGGQSFKTRSEFLRASAEAMRRILVDQAQGANAQKRGGRWKRVDLADGRHISQTPEQVLALNEALHRLAAVEPRKAELVTLRFFGGLSMPEAAKVLEISLPTAERWWSFARSWLYTELVEPVE
jgi:RNA polymerase sigma factor (TIGR02999 family)